MRRDVKYVRDGARHLAGLSVACLLGVAAAADGQTVVEPATISSNRPGFSETADVAGRGVLQLETGITFDGDRVGDDTASTFTGPAYLIRYGIARRFEFQAVSEGLFSHAVTVGGAASRETGMADLDLGVKAKLTTESEIGVNLALLAAVNLPTGTPAFSSGGYDPSFKLAASRGLPGGWTGGGNLQWAWATVSGTREQQHALSASLSRGFAAGWSGYGEVFRLGGSSGAPTATSVQGGVARVVGANMQLDLSVGRGLSGVSTDWFVTTGVAIRRHGARQRTVPVTTAAAQ